MADSDETIPTATIEDAVNQYLFADERQAKMVFVDQKGNKFGLLFDVEKLSLIDRMCAILVQRWHAAKPEDEGSFFRNIYNVSVSTSSQIRNVVGIQFDGGVGLVVPKETALELAELIVKKIEEMETPSERKERLAKKTAHIVVPKQRIILPP
jgi:hypothetical protein